MKPIFRNSMFGFNKEDVAAFIAKQNQQFDAKMAELQSKLDSQARDFSRRERELVCDQEELETLRSERKDFDKEKEARREDLAEIAMLAELFATERDALDVAFDESCETVESLGDELDLARERLKKSDSYREKAEKFDRLASVLGEIVSGKNCELEEGAEQEEPVTLPSAEKAVACIAREREALKALQSTCEELIARVKKLEEKL